MAASYTEFEKATINREIGSIDDVRKALLEMAFSYRRTAKFYIGVLTGVIGSVILLFLAVRYFGFSAEITKELDWTVAAANVTLHLGAVVLVIYLSQLLIGFSRYHYRVADKLFSQANGVTICMASNDLEKLQTFVECMSLDIDFGKMPATPTDKVLDTLAKVQPISANK